MISQWLLSDSRLLVAATEPARWRLRWSWDWPLWVTVASAMLAVAWVAAIYAAENSPAGRPVRSVLTLLRLFAILLAALMLAQPVIEWRQVGRPRLVVLVDRSASMSTGDVNTAAGEQSRWQATKQLLAQGNQPLLAAWQENYQLDVVAFDDQFTRLGGAESNVVEQLRELPVADDPGGATRLGDAINYAVRELPGPLPAAVVVWTDGLATRGLSLPAAAQRARALRVPLYTVAVGSDRPRPDVALEDMIVEDAVFPGDRLQVELTLRAVGYAGQSAHVMLRHSESSELFAETDVTLLDDGTIASVRLAVRPAQPGPLPLTVVVEPLPGESDVENNSASQVVDVSSDKLRVLLVQSSPSYEYRALKSLLERDPAVDLKVRLQEADAEFADVDAAALRGFPSGEEGLLDYDVIILGDVDPGLLPRAVWPRLERFVAEHGGGLVCIAGPRFMPAAFRTIRSMQVLLPIHLLSVNPLRMRGGQVSSYPIHPTALGWQTPSMQLGDTSAESEAVWRRLPPVTWLLEIQQTKPAARVLAEDPSRTNQHGNRLPIIVRHYVGAGEVLFHATDETWRWRWRSDDRYFARYWGQVVRRLGRGRLAAGREGVRLTVDRASYQPGEEVRLQVRFRDVGRAPAADEGVVVRLQADDRSAQEIVLRRRLGRRGLFEATAAKLPSGEYAAQLVQPASIEKSAEARFAVRQPPREMARIAADIKALRAAAERTGGKSYTMDDASRLTEELPPPREASVDAMPPRQLWNSHAVMALFVLVLVSEWFLRRRCGML